MKQNHLIRENMIIISTRKPQSIDTPLLDRQYMSFKGLSKVISSQYYLYYILFDMLRCYQKLYTTPSAIK